MRRWAFMVGTFTVASVVSAVACVGEDPDPVTVGNDGGGAADMGTGTVDAPVAIQPSRGCPLNCLPPAPAGWTGPSAVYDGAPSAPSAPSCPKLYPVAEVTAHHLGETPAPICGCENSVSTGSASACTYLYEKYSEGSCATKTGSSAVPGGCVDTSDRAGFKITAGTLVGKCTDPAGVIVKVAPNIDREIVACGLTTASACADRADCVATPLPLDPPFTRLCIHKDGDVDCPSADYAVRAVVHRKIDDTRACPACTGKLTGTCASGFDIVLAAPPDCSSPTSASVGTCYPTSAVKGLLGPTTTPQSVTCSATPAMPTGDVHATDPVTFCCNK